MVSETTPYAEYILYFSGGADIMEEIRGRIEVVPDPELMIEKMMKRRMHMWGPTGIFLVIAGIWWLMANMKLVPKMVMGPGLTILAGIMCLTKMKMHHKKEW
jgi:hypothetical protein